MKNLDMALKAFMKENKVNEKSLLDDIRMQTHGYQLALQAVKYVQMFTGTSSFSVKDLESLLK